MSVIRSTLNMVNIDLQGYRLASFLFETLLLTMLSYKVIGSLRSVRVLQTMLRDGLWAYALMSGERGSRETCDDTLTKSPFTVIILTNILLYGLVKNALSAVGFP